MNIEQATKELRYEQEHGITDRFPCRAIMVAHLTQYVELIEMLRQIPGAELVPSSLLFRGEDVLPNYEALYEFLRENNDKWLILPGVSEYLRLFSANEARRARFGDLWRRLFPAETTKGRILIPLLPCDSIWHDRELHLMDDRRIQEERTRFFDCVGEAKAERFRFTVYSGGFRRCTELLEKKHGRVFQGIRALHDYFAAPVAAIQDFAVITDRVSSIRQLEGEVSVHVVRSVLSFLQKNMAGGQHINASNCDESMQELLLQEAMKGKSLEESILSILNIGTFSTVDVCSRWNKFGVKELIRLWFELHEDDSYLCYAVRGAENSEQIETRVLHKIFKVKDLHPAWIRESQDLIAAMKLKRDNEYFAEVSKIDDYEERLAYLTGDTQEERRYLLTMTGKWLREDRVAPKNSEKLASVYPVLSAYLGEKCYDADLAAYMSRYKTYKLSNTLPEDDALHFDGVESEHYDCRYAALASVIDETTCILWVDALGAEWLPLLLQTLGKVKEAKLVSHAVTRANLPSETKFNNQWDHIQGKSEKINKLDKLAHKGVIDDPDYYACVEEQLRFFDKIEEKVIQLFSQYNRVIITGDHGTSRLAARFFHVREGCMLSQGEVKSHGRYAAVPADFSALQANQILAKDSDGKRYVVFKNYDHFKQSGFAAGVDDDTAIYGEIHGGGSPEEVLVPVVVMERKETLPLAAMWDKNPVKIFMRKAKTMIRFNQPVQTLEVRIGEQAATVASTDDKKLWKVEAAIFKGGTYGATLVANGRIVSVEPLTVQSALSNADGDLP